MLTDSCCFLCCSEVHNMTNDWVKLWIHIGHLHIDGLKMSKSLKNFISIREYLNSGITSAPEVDLRLFFLQHKYHSTLHYSTDRIHEAAAFRNKVDRFLEQLACCRSVVAKSGSAICKPTATAQALLRDIASCRERVVKALANDFDTPTALLEISELTSRSNTYMQSLLVHAGSLPIEPLLDAESLIVEVLESFGVRLRSHKPQAKDCVGDYDAALETFVEFRARVRAAALQGLKVKTETGCPESRSALLNVMKICDSARDKDAAALGIHISDVGNISTWSRT